MIVYVPSWLESSYLELYPLKRICLGNYEETLWDEDGVVIFIKNMNKNYEIYETSENIIVILSTAKDNVKEITTEYVIKKLCEKFDYPYDKKIVQFCEKAEIYSPFVIILTLSLGGQLPTPIPKELVPLNSTISTSKYLQISLWFYFLNKKNNNIFKSYSPEKCLYFFNAFIDLEREFGFVDEELAHVFLLPILYFHN